MVGLELTRWGWQMSNWAQKHMGKVGCTRIDAVGSQTSDRAQERMVEVGEWQMSIWAQKGTVGMVDERSGSKGHSQGWETSVRAQIDMVELKVRNKAKAE